MKYVFLGLSITSAWGNGHATTYRSLLRELSRRGHDVVFLERDVPWYRENRDLPFPPYANTILYADRAELEARHGELIRDADVIIVGSYLPEGIAVSDWVLGRAQGVVAFYDIDTPITLAGLARGGCSYLDPSAIPRFDLYLSFTGGPTLERLAREYGARKALPLYCSVDPELYFPEPCERRFALGYLGTYSEDRQPTLDALLIEPARALPQRAFVVAGPQYPETIRWPANVERIMHLAPDGHRAFYNQQDFTLNVTRREMVRAGYSPSVRLFEAAACGVPIISDPWPGLDSFFPAGEILIAHDKQDVIRYLRDVTVDQREQIAALARRRVLREHSAAQRAAQLDGYIEALRKRPSVPREARRAQHEGADA